VECRVGFKFVLGSERDVERERERQRDREILGEIECVRSKGECEI